MAWLPIQGIVPQATENGNQADGYVLKFYEPGTTTPLTVATDNTGGTTTSSFLLDSEGYTTLSGNIVIPHVDQSYKAVLYLNETDANADDTGSAVYVVDDVGVAGSVASSISYSNTTSGLTATNVQTAIDENADDIDDINASVGVSRGDTNMGSYTGAGSILTDNTTAKANIQEIGVQFNALFENFINGFTTSNGSTPDQEIDITAGNCADSTNTVVMTGAADTIDITTADNKASLTADTWYHIFVVSDSSNANTTYFFDTSITAANCLAGSYAGGYYRRIASVLTDGTSDIIPYIQFGDEFLWDVGVMDVDATVSVTTAVTPTLSVPSGVQVFAKISASGISQASVNRFWLISSPSVTDTAPTVSHYNMATDGDSGSITHDEGPYTSTVLTNTSSQIRYRVNDASGTLTLRVFTEGWIDLRGKE